MLLCALSVGAFSRSVNPDSIAGAVDVMQPESIPSPLPPPTEIEPLPTSIADSLSPDSTETSDAGEIVARRPDTPADITANPQSAPSPEQIASPDSAILNADSTGIAADSLASQITRHTYTPDTTRRSQLTRRRITPPEKGSNIVRTKVDLDNAVDFSAQDSMVLIGRNTAFMYGDSKVSYGNIKLDAEQIEMNLDNNTVYAMGGVDSVGDLFGTPVFEDNGTSYEAKTMHYNFKTEYGYITDVITQQGEGYLTGGQTKKIDENTFYVQHGRYTTCDNHDDPHFYLQLTKAKVRPGKDVFSGPAYMVLG